MVDIVNKVIRSRMMAGIAGKNTKPEIVIRKALHCIGFRFKLHCADLPGKPDIVFPKYAAIILINGCFWHRHNCHMFRWPSTHKSFWRKKLLANRARDERNRASYKELGWKVLIIWECALKGKTRRPLSEVVNTAANWLKFGSRSTEIIGRIPKP